MKELFFQNWIFIISGVLMSLVGILIQKLKLYNLIAGYNTSSSETKRKINIELVAIALRNAFLIIGAIWILIPIIIDLLNLKMIIKILLVIIGHFGIIIWLLNTINNNEKYKIKPAE